MTDDLMRGCNFFTNSVSRSAKRRNAFNTSLKDSFRGSSSCFRCAFSASLTWSTHASPGDDPSGLLVAAACIREDRLGTNRCCRAAMYEPGCGHVRIIVVCLM